VCVCVCVKIKNGLCVELLCKNTILRIVKIVLNEVFAFVNRDV